MPHKVINAIAEADEHKRITKGRGRGERAVGEGLLGG